MLEAQIPKDIRKYESKFILFFTIKQTVCVIIAGVIAIILFNVLKPMFGSQVAGYACLIASIPEVLIGWVKVQGIPFEKFVQTAIVGNVLAPKVRVYKINQPYRQVLKPIHTLTQKELKKSRKKREALAKSNPDYQYYM